MHPGKLLLGLAFAGALGMSAAASSASAATVVNVGTLPPANPYFYLTGGSLPTSPVITANLGATISGASTSFDDSFQFTIPQNGKGSGSLSTSFSSPVDELTISQVLINNVSYPLIGSSGGQSLTVNNIPILNGVMNTIEVKGVTSSTSVNATYAGTATFNAAAVPEPASWALMIGGVGLIGAALRRQRNALHLA